MMAVDISSSSVAGWPGPGVDKREGEEGGELRCDIIVTPLAEYLFQAVGTMWVRVGLKQRGFAVGIYIYGNDNPRLVTLSASDSLKYKDKQRTGPLHSLMEHFYRESTAAS